MGITELVDSVSDIALFKSCMTARGVMESCREAIRYVDERERLKREEKMCDAKKAMAAMTDAIKRPTDASGNRKCMSDIMDEEIARKRALKEQLRAKELAERREWEIAQGKPPMSGGHAPRNTYKIGGYEISTLKRADLILLASALGVQGKRSLTKDELITSIVEKYYNRTL